MKKTLLALSVILALILPAKAQEKEEKLKELEKLEQKTEKVATPDTLVYEAEEEITVMEEEITVTEAEEEIVFEEEGEEYAEQDTSRIKIGDIVTVEETDDETVIRIGKKAVRIITGDDDTEVRFEECEEREVTRRPGRSFEGHLGGVEFGYNAWSTDQWGRNDGTIEEYLDLNTAKSSSFNIVAPPVSLGFSRHFGIVTGLGVNFNSYRFDGNNTLTVGDGGVVGPAYPAEGINYEKSKLATVYGILPVMLEVQIPVTYSSTINLGAGVIGAVKLGSHTKTVYYDDGKQKEKNHNDFNLNVLRYGVTARAGYEMIQVYGTCYLSPMFEKNKGPELYPFEVGIALTIND